MLVMAVYTKSIAFAYTRNKNFKHEPDFKKFNFTKHKAV